MDISDSNPKKAAQLQELLNKMTDSRIQLMSDSSSPGQYPVFGTYLHSGNYKTQTFTELYFQKMLSIAERLMLNKVKMELYPLIKLKKFLVVWVVQHVMILHMNI